MIQLDRITQDAGVMGGKACIRGMRVTVGMIVGQIGAGHSIAEILADYPYLEREDVLQALRYAAWLPVRSVVKETAKLVRLFSEVPVFLLKQHSLGSTRSQEGCHRQ
jgi:uncharacterized protein (DUF433 family)